MEQPENPELTQLQNLQRQLQIVTSQKQRFEFEAAQTELCLDELKKAEGKVYKAIGTLLVESKKNELKKELSERKENMSLRIETLKKQEEKLKTKVEELMKKIESNIKK